MYCTLRFIKKKQEKCAHLLTISLFLLLTTAATSKPAKKAGASSGSIKVTFIKPDGSKQEVTASIGDSMLEVAHANKIDIEGACGGETACSTCHVYVDPVYFKKLPEVSEAEEDMLDLAAGLKDGQSRLGCQIFAAKNLDGMVLTMPKEVKSQLS